MAKEVGSSHWWPKVIVPRQTSETFRPVRPTRRVFMAGGLGGEGPASCRGVPGLTQGGLWGKRGWGRPGAKTKGQERCRPITVLALSPLWATPLLCNILEAMTSEKSGKVRRPSKVVLGA